MIVGTQNIKPQKSYINLIEIVYFDDVGCRKRKLGVLFCGAEF